jgi:hypothetical protein
MIDPQKWAIVVWVNPQYVKNSRQRIMETITSADGKNPVAFPLKHLRKLLPEALFSENSFVFDDFLRSSEEKPLVVTLQQAESALGIKNFSYSDITEED